MFTEEGTQNTLSRSSKVKKEANIVHGKWTKLGNKKSTGFHLTIKEWLLQSAVGGKIFDFINKNCWNYQISILTSLHCFMKNRLEKLHKLNLPGYFISMIPYSATSWNTYNCIFYIYIKLYIFIHLSNTEEKSNLIF